MLKVLHGTITAKIVLLPVGCSGILFETIIIFGAEMKHFNLK